MSDGLAIYRRLQGDDQDSVRLLTVEDLIAIAQQLTPPEVKDQLLKQIRQSVTDKSWRVRYMAASHFNEVCHLAVDYSTPLMLVVRLARRSSGSGSCSGRADRPICWFIERQRGGSTYSCRRSNSRSVNTAHHLFRRDSICQ